MRYCSAMKCSALSLACSVVATAALAAQSPARASSGLTAVEGIKVGHHTLTERPTGCTVILVDGDAVGGVSQRGGAPGTRETDLLNPLNMVDKVNAVVLSGGSAFGLEAATGTVRWLEEHNIGWPAGPSKVPIVPAAILFDLGVGGNPKVRPTADCGYKAAEAATAGPVQEGTVGAGAGATVGKLGGANKSMKSGLGTASISLPNGLVVAAIVAVNAVGDIIDPANGKVVAGVRNPDGTLADARKILRAGGTIQRPRAGENTTIGLVATNARHQSARHPHGVDGRRWLCPRDQPVAHQRRRRHDLFAGDGTLGRQRRHHDDRRARRGSDGRRRRSRRDAGDRRRGHSSGARSEEVSAPRAMWNSEFGRWNS